MEKIKLVIPSSKPDDLLRFEHLRLNLSSNGNGRKPKREKNLYKRQMTQIRRLLR